MSVIDEGRAREELTVFLRNSNVLSTSVRGVTTVVSEVFSGTGVSQVLTLANNVVRNIRSVDDGSVLKPYLDYIPSYGVSSTTISGVFASGTNNVVVSYDYSSGTAEKVWGDFPDFGNINASDFPRVGFDFISGASVPLGIGDTNYFSNKLASVKVYANKIGDIEDALTILRQAVKDSQKDFYYFQFVKLGNLTPLLVYDGFAKKIREKGVDLELTFGFES